MTAEWIELLHMFAVAAIVLGATSVVVRVAARWTGYVDDTERVRWRRGLIGALLCIAGGLLMLWMLR